MTAEFQTLAALKAALSPPWPHDPLPAIREQLKARNEKLIVLDDDPTGTQTVHDITVLTCWSVELLARELTTADPVLYILTNSRSLTEADAVARTREIVDNVLAAARQTGVTPRFISRSDSTLRGHFPAETDALQEAAGLTFDATLLIPFFAEGERLTLDDTHYVCQEGQLVPASETPFAQDAVFGYANAHLPAWVEEKTGGRVSREAVGSLSLSLLRDGGPAAVADYLLQLPPQSVCVVNAIEYRDLEVAVAGIVEAEARGKQFLYRTAASFVRSRAALEPRDLLDRDCFDKEEPAGGLIVVGSYVQQTTSQLAVLLDRVRPITVELDVRDVLSSDDPTELADLLSIQLDRVLQHGRDVVLHTSREPLDVSPESGQQISHALAAVVSAVGTRPRYILAKGGITASDLATRALDVCRATVRGQLLPGVPVWRLEEPCRYPGLDYIVFPGNVGDASALANAVQLLAR